MVDTKKVLRKAVPVLSATTTTKQKPANKSQEFSWNYFKIFFSHMDLKVMPKSPANNLDKF